MSTSNYTHLVQTKHRNRKAVNMLATLEQIFLPHKSEGIGIGTGTTLFGSFALNLSLLSPMRKLGVSIELEPSH